MVRNKSFDALSQQTEAIFNQTLIALSPALNNNTLLYFSNTDSSSANSLIIENHDKNTKHTESSRPRGFD